MLDLLRVEESDLSLFYFLNFPDYLPSEQCREQLEYEILNAWDKECDEDNIPDSEREPPAITTYWLYRVLRERSQAELDSLDMDSRLEYTAKSTAKIWEYRIQNRAEIVAGRMPPLPEPLPLHNPRCVADYLKPRTQTTKNKKENTNEQAQIRRVLREGR